MCIKAAGIKNKRFSTWNACPRIGIPKVPMNKGWLDSAAARLEGTEKSGYDVAEEHGLEGL